MTTNNVFRFSAYALVAAFVFSLVGGLAHPVVDGHAHSAESFLAPASPWAQISIYVGAILLSLGLPGCYVWFRERLGVLGFVGFLLYFVANTVMAQSHLVVEAFVGPTIAEDPTTRHLIPDNGSIFDAGPFMALMAVGTLFMIGSMILVGISLIRAQGLPTWLGWFLALGAALLLVPFPEVPVLSGIQVEVPRGVAVFVLAVIMLRELAARRAVRDPRPLVEVA
jgi:hypothetical protein